MWSRIKAFINPPANDPDEIRRRQIMSVLLRGLLGLSLFALVVILIFLSLNPDKWKESGNQLTIISAAVATLISIVIFQVNKHSSRLSALLLLTLLTLISIFSDTPEQLSNGRSLFIFTLPIAVSSLIFAPISSFLFAVANSIIITILAYQSNTVPNITAIAGFLMLAFISWLSARGLEQAIQDLRVTNTNLDNIVTERTRELTDALSRERIESGRNQAILNSIADGVIVFDSENMSILANPALGNLTGKNVDELIGVDFNQFISAEKISASDREMMAGLIKHPEKNEAAIRVDWGQKTLSTSMARVLTSEDENIGTVTVFRDITQEAHLEKMKDNFVAIVSHELRTPLNAIMGHAEIMKEAVYGSLNEKQVSIMERIMINVSRLLSMVGDLLDEAQIKAGKLSIKPQVIETDSLLENLHGSMDKITADKGLTLITELSADMPKQIIGDPQRIQQILINLTGNAIKFTEKGSIRVHINRGDKNQWKIEVIDSGIGIPENELPYIFDAFRQANNLEFSTRKHGGFGLGLSIVKQLIELMGGEISVKSKIDKGSTFTVVLPMEVHL